MAYISSKEKQRQFPESSVDIRWTIYFHKIISALQGELKSSPESACKQLLSTYSRRVFSVFTESHSLREKYSYSEIFWPVFSRIRIEYEEILRISLY